MLNLDQMFAAAEAEINEEIGLVDVSQLHDMGDLMAEEEEKALEAL